MDVRQRLGNRIRQLREVAGMSQKDLSFAADLDRSYIASIESGQRNVSIVNIERIAHALGVSLRQFFEDADFDTAPPKP
jgi:transcriptional regulator with XRE-family HTH domain